MNISMDVAMDISMLMSTDISTEPAMASRLNAATGFKSSWLHPNSAHPAWLGHHPGLDGAKEHVSFSACLVGTAH